jgi:hypothetical protein
MLLFVLYNFKRLPGKSKPDANNGQRKWQIQPDRNQTAI